jgi:hypothetical protein
MQLAEGCCVTDGQILKGSPLNTEKKTSRRMVTFVGIIFAIAVVLAGTYILISKPGDPGGKTLTAPQDGTGK